jgi:hypothetical protein
MHDWEMGDVGAARTVECWADALERTLAEMPPATEETPLVGPSALTEGKFALLVHNAFPDGCPGCQKFVEVAWPIIEKALAARREPGPSSREL